MEISPDDLPSTDQIYGWISEIFGRGIRRPGYPADVWTEDWIERQFSAYGLENVHREPVRFRKWEPGRSLLRVTTATGAVRDLEHFPVPYSAPVDGLELELCNFDPRNPQTTAGKAAIYFLEFMTIDATAFARSGSAPEDMTGRILDDPEGSLSRRPHTVPFGPEFQEVMAPVIEAGGAAFIGALKNPGNTCDYYVPYGPADVSLPGVYIKETDGEWLRDELLSGPVRVRLTVESEVSDAETYNIVGELPGADDEIVIIGSHHDGPWASAVEDASGTALVVAQVHYWSRQHPSNRPHRLRFILQGAHMWGGAGLFTYVDAHRLELEHVVLEVHLEHAALETDRDAGGNIVVSDLPVPRWFFTSRLASLEAAVAKALTAENLTRSMIMAPDAFGTAPPTDGQGYHTAGVPIVNVLAAPWYLFDSADTLDKIDRENLVPITRTAIRIVDFTRTTTAADLRAEAEPGS